MASVPIEPLMAAQIQISSGKSGALDVAGRGHWRGGGVIAAEGRSLPRAGEGRGDGVACTVCAFELGVAAGGRVLAASGRRSSRSRSRHGVKGGPQARASAFTLDAGAWELG